MSELSTYLLRQALRWVRRPRHRRGRASLLAAVPLVIAISAAVSSCAAPPNTGNALYDASVYAASSSTEQRASLFFCGNITKPTPSTPCKPNYPAAEDGKVIQHVEVRGWIVDDPTFKDYYPDWHETAQELVFDLKLDHGWMPLADNVTPFSSPSAVDQAITPVNFSSLTDQPLPDTKGNVYGGPDPIIHVEVDGWDPNGRECRRFDYLDRVCRDPGDPGPPPNPPDQTTDWVPKPGMADGAPLGSQSKPNAGTVYWPFDPDGPQLAVAGLPRHRLAKGDYVRLVGTIWEDHNLPHGNPGGDCWNGGFTEHRGWIEMHPVDLLAVVYPPGTTVVYPPGTSTIPTTTQTSSPDNVEWITACGDATVVRTIPAPARPSPADDYQVGCQWWTDGDFTVYQNVYRHTVNATADGVIVRFLQQASSNAGAKFDGVYDVYWERKGGPGCVEIHPASAALMTAPPLPAGSAPGLADSLQLQARWRFLPFAVQRPSPAWAGTPLTVSPPNPADEEGDFPVKTYHLVAGRWTR
jgi:hypothetical protein